MEGMPQLMLHFQPFSKNYLQTAAPLNAQVMFSEIFFFTSLMTSEIVI
jgi:hypothetical protein